MYLRNLELVSGDRFLSKDPIGFSSGDSNIYRYAFGNPIFYRDPSGLAIFNPTNLPGVPNSCGPTPLQNFYEHLQASPVPVIIAGGEGALKIHRII